MFKLSFLVLFMTGCTILTPGDLRTIKLTLTETPMTYCGTKLYGEVLGCAKLQDLQCEVIVKQPRSFEDRKRLETLGHEVWHCFSGPKH